VRKDLTARTRPLKHVREARDAWSMWEEKTMSSGETCFPQLRTTLGQFRIIYTLGTFQLN
jgi:hypothetical protein